MGKPGSKHPERCGEYKGQQLYRHKKPDQCRQQLVDGFCRKIPTLPNGELGLLVVLPADKRGPVRIQTHNMTMPQAAATIAALNESLPFKQERLDSWVRKVLRQQRRSCRKRNNKRSSE